MEGCKMASEWTGSTEWKQDTQGGYSKRDKSETGNMHQQQCKK